MTIFCDTNSYVRYQIGVFVGEWMQILFWNDSIIACI